MLPFSLILNGEQARVATPRIGWLADDSDWDGTHSDTWLCPASNTLMLKPNFMFDSFSTSGSGINARLTLSDFSLTAGNYATGDWATKSMNNIDRLIKLSMSAEVETNFDFPIDTGVYISYFCFSVPEKRDARYLECGWGGDFQIRVWSSGILEVWEDEVKVNEYQLGNSGGTGGQNQFQELAILPYRKSEVLIYNITNGSMQLHPLARANMHDAAPFWFFVPDGNIDVSIAPVKYPASGYAKSKKFTLAEAPSGSPETWANDPALTTITNAYISGDAASGCAVSSFVMENGSGSTYTTGKNVQGKVTLTGDAWHTPFVYGVQYGWPSIINYTPSGYSASILSAVKRMDFQVPDDPFGTTLSMSLRYDLFTALTSGMGYTLESENWPIQLKYGDQIVFEGRTGLPKIYDGLYDGLKYVELECRDHFFQSTQMMFRERAGTDGMLVCNAPVSGGYNSAIEFILNQTPVSFYLQNAGITMPDVPVDGSKWASSFDIGTTFQQALQDIHTTYIPSWYFGTHPTTGFPDYPGTEVAVSQNKPDQLTLSVYRTETDALRPSYSNLNQQILPIEANEVRVTGWNPFTKKPLQAVKFDADSWSPTIWPRPANWLGERRPLGYADPKLTTQAAVNAAASGIFATVSQSQIILEFDCPNILIHSSGLPMWRGDKVNLEDWGEYTITSMNWSFVTLSEVNGEDNILINAKYTAGTLKNRGGASGLEISLKSQYEAMNRMLQKFMGPILLSYTPKVAVEL